jgi:hypothetical protein
MIPRFLKKQLEFAEGEVQRLKVLSHIESMQPRIQEAKNEFERLTDLVYAISKHSKNKKYTDQQVFAVLDSGLSVKGESQEDCAMLIEANTEALKANEEKRKNKRSV